MKNFALLLATVFAIGVTPAMAQFAPGSQQVLREVDGENTLPPLASPQDAEQVASTLENNPCPEPKKALGETPDDLAKIQEDITRFTLCVQRAQLLERLNELAEANIETIDTALNLAVEKNMDGGNAVPGVMPQIPMPQLSNDATNMAQEPSFDPVPDFTNRIPAAADIDWKVRDIQGSGGKITAQLVGDDGSFLKVKQGDALPDEGGKIITLTNTMVRVEKDGKKHILQWVQ